MNNATIQKQVDRLLASHVVEVDGVKYLNATPHVLNFGSGHDTPEADQYEFEVKPSGFVVAATPVTVDLGVSKGVHVYKTGFQPNPEHLSILIGLRLNNVIVVGSLINVNTYPGLIYGVIPAKGYERVAPEEKRMKPKAFNVG